MPEFLADLGRIRLGLPMAPGKAREGLATSLVLERDEPIEYFIDGDLYQSAAPVRVGVGPRIRVITS